MTVDHTVSRLCFAKPSLLVSCADRVLHGTRKVHNPRDKATIKRLQMYKSGGKAIRFVCVLVSVFMRCVIVFVFVFVFVCVRACVVVPSYMQWIQI